MKRLFTAATLCLLLAGCSDEVQVKNVTSSETILLRTNTKYPSSIKIEGSGRIEGKAKISLILNGKPYQTEHLDGDVKFEWRGDWYSKEAVIEYHQGTAKSGNLTLKYDF